MATPGRPTERDHFASYSPEELEKHKQGLHLSPGQKYKKMMFARELLKDFNGAAALARIGCHYEKITSARKMATDLMQCPFVANEVDKLIRSMEEKMIVTRNQVLSRMWQEANDWKNEGSTRVKALSHLAKMLGMMKDLVLDRQDVPQNVMLIPCMSAEGWEAAAAAAQMSLKERAVSPALPPPPPPPPQPAFAHSSS